MERDDLDLPAEQARDLAGRIAANARRLDRIVADLLDLERLAAGVIEPIFAPVDVGALVRELAANADVMAGRRLQLDTAPLVIPADAMMIERIVENLLGNAAKHTPGDSRIWVRVERTDDGALIAVEDDGPGVPRATRSGSSRRSPRATPPARGARRRAGARGPVRVAARWPRLGPGTPRRRRVVPSAAGVRTPRASARRDRARF